MALVDALKSTLSQWGLEELAQWIIDQERAGKEPLEIVTDLRQTDAYKARFPAMAELQKAGQRNNMPVIDEGQYLQMEQSYRTALQDSGLPAGMFDSADDFKALLENDIDPTEVKERVAAAKVAVEQTDSNVVDQLREMYGLSTQDLMAYALDPAKNAPYIQKIATAATLAGLAESQGLAATRLEWERYSQEAMNQGLGQGQINEAVATASVLKTSQSRLAGLEGEKFTDQDAMDISLTKDAKKVLKSQKRAERERARFSGSSGIASGGLGGSTL